jgi:hypothetical protein
MAIDAARQDEYKIKNIGLKAKFKLGELLHPDNRPKIGKTKEYGSSGGTIPNLPSGINKKVSHNMQTLARNQNKVTELIAKAKEKNYDPPSDNEIIKKVKKEERKVKQYEKEQEIICTPPHAWEGYSSNN